ncbi:hypothetical protein TNCV_3906701 [Trichonephila clavipes]|nr:hypothetical protein TNCV_3906701 [Trichonephila clavipes]
MLKLLQLARGFGSPVVKVSDHGRHVMSSSPVQLRTCHEGQRYTLNLSRDETLSHWCGVVLNGYVNKQNCRIWSEANPQVYVETPLHPEKLTVWSALWAGGIIGPYFFKNDEGHNVTVNGDRYRAMITSFFIPELKIMRSRSCGSNKAAQHVTQLVPQSIY